MAIYNIILVQLVKNLSILNTERNLVFLIKMTSLKILDLRIFY